MDADVGKLLDRALRLRDHAPASAQAIDRALGHPAGYFSRIAAGKRQLTIDVLFTFMRSVGLEPQGELPGFFGFHLDLYLAELAKQDEGQVRLLEARLESAEAPNCGVDVLRSRVAGLEDLRLRSSDDARQEALRLLAGLAGPVDPPSESEVWGVLAALHRARGEFSAAAWCLRRAMRLAKETGEGSLEARNLQRASYLIADQGDLDEALEIVHEATQLYAVATDLVGVGKTWVDAGILLGKMGRLAEAVRAFENSLQALPEEAWHSRFSVFQGLGVIYVDVGRLGKASRCLAKAQSILCSQPRSASHLKHWIGWLQGELAMKRERFQEAERHFTSLHESYMTSGGAGDVALVSLRISKILWLTGRFDELRAFSERMFPLLSEFADNSFVEAALSDFLRASLSGELTPTLIDSVYGTIRSAARVRLAPPLI